MNQPVAFFIWTLLVSAAPISALLPQAQRAHVETDSSAALRDTTAKPTTPSQQPHPSWVIEAAGADPSFIVDFIREHNCNEENEECKSRWTFITDIVQSPPSNVKLHFLDETANFTRPAPKSLDPNLLASNWKPFNILQVRIRKREREKE